jgi:hypothetical protein
LKFLILCHATSVFKLLFSSFSYNVCFLFTLSDSCLCNSFLDLQIKTGGLVVWSKKNTLVVYRGLNYQLTSKNFLNTHTGLAGGQDTPLYKKGQLRLERNSDISQVNSNGSFVDEKICQKDSERETLPGGIFFNEDLNCQPVSGSLYEREMDRLLDGLGPRFIDWWMHKPLPVDADLLPEVVSGFRPPFRLCPPHTRAKLTDDELTYLRKLAKTLPTHFVLGITLPTVICQFYPEHIFSGNN